jgi:two-component system cell cycle response regulator
LWLFPREDLRNPSSFESLCRFNKTGMPTKILTVDDSLTVRLVLAKAFQPYDCEILEARNGQEGLAVARREQPDLIILDLCMPVMDGIDMLSQLRADPHLKSTRVIMLTAESDHRSVFHIRELGVSDYILKPFREDHLLQRVMKILPLQKREPVAR